MNVVNVLTAICSLMFFMIGADKFLAFMDPPCSLETTIAPIIWKGMGVLQLIGGVLIWIPKFRKFVAGFFIAYMLFFTGYHLMLNTYDVGGAVFIAVLLGIILWNPSFLRGKNKQVI